MKCSYLSRFLFAATILSVSCLLGCDGTRVSKEGLSIDRLGSAAVQDFKMAGADGWIMALSAEGGFAPNVNWMKQTPATDMSMEDFLELSRKQYAEMNATIIGENVVSPSLLEMEVTFVGMGKDTRVFQCIIMSGSSFYVVTGTALESQWGKYGEQLKACVRSARAD